MDHSIVHYFAFSAVFGSSYLHKLGEGGCTELPYLKYPRATHACAKVFKTI